MNTVISCIEELIILKHYVLKRILTDCGLEFVNRQATPLKEKYGIMWDYSVPDHHKTVGLVERVKKIMDCNKEASKV